MESYAEDEPRSRTALPDFRQRAAASTVTFGPGLVDDADDAERDADLAQVDAVGQGRAAHDLADRVGQRDDVPHVGGDGRAPAPG